MIKRIGRFLLSLWVIFFSLILVWISYEMVRDGSNPCMIERCE